MFLSLFFPLLSSLTKINLYIKLVFFKLIGLCYSHVPTENVDTALFSRLLNMQTLYEPSVRGKYTFTNENWELRKHSG